MMPKTPPARESGLSGVRGKIGFGTVEIYLENL